MKQRGFGVLIYLIVGAVIVATLAGAYFKITHDARTAGYAEAKAECEAAAKAQREAEAKQAAAASKKLEVQRAETKIKYRTITKAVDRYIDRPVYRNVCLDSDGLRDLATAFRRPGTATDGTDKPVPRPDAAK